MLLNCKLCVAISIYLLWCNQGHRFLIYGSGCNIRMKTGYHGYITYALSMLCNVVTRDYLRLDMAFGYVSQHIVGFVHIATSQWFYNTLSACVWGTLAMIILIHFVAIQWSRKCKPTDSDDQPYVLATPRSAAALFTTIDASDLYCNERKRLRFLSILGRYGATIMYVCRQLVPPVIGELTNAVKQLQYQVVQLVSVIANPQPAFQTSHDCPLRCGNAQYRSATVRWVNCLRFWLWELIGYLSAAITSPGDTWNQFVGWSLDVAASLALPPTSDGTAAGHFAASNRDSPGNCIAMNSAAIPNTVEPTAKRQVALTSQHQNPNMRVDSCTRKFCFGYLLFVVCIVLTQSPFVQITVCILYCLMVHVLDYAAATSPVASESSAAPGCNTSNTAAAKKANRQNDCRQPAMSTHVVITAPADEDAITESLVDILMRFLANRITNNPVARLFCCVTTGAVAALSVARYPQTVIVIFIWFALHETSECCAVIAFARELVEPVLQQLMFKFECRSCAKARASAAENATAGALHSQHEAGTRLLAPDLQVEQTGHEYESIEQNPSHCNPSSRTGILDSAQDHTTCWSLFNGKYCVSTGSSLSHMAPVTNATFAGHGLGNCRFPP